MATLCQRCKRRTYTGIWLLVDPKGDILYRALCAECGLGYYPTLHKWRIVLLKSSTEFGPSPKICMSPMKSTGVFTPTDVTTFFEMRCTKCGYIADFPLNRVKDALLNHKHERATPFAQAPKEDASIGGDSLQSGSSDSDIQVHLEDSGVEDSSDGAELSSSEAEVEDILQED